MSYLLNLHDRVGPIGAHLKQLYLKRQSETIMCLTADIDRHGVFSPSRLFQTHRISDLIFERALNLMT